MREGGARRSAHDDGAVVVAVAAVGVVQVAIDEVIDVVAVRHRFMAATRAVNVAGRVATTRVFRGAIRRVDRGDG